MRCPKVNRSNLHKVMISLGVPATRASVELFRAANASKEPRSVLFPVERILNSDHFHLFAWHKTPQGFDFWNELQGKLHQRNIQLMQGDPNEKN